MKQLISLLVLAAFFFSSMGFAAKTPKSKAGRKAASTSSKTSKAKKDKDKKWNQICQGLLETSVDSTLKLEKSVKKKKKISKNEFENKIQNELMVVQLNAWVCALSTKGQLGVAAEEQFLKDYSQLVQSKKL